MLAMYDEKEILREYIEYEKYHAAKEAAKKATKEAKENAIKKVSIPLAMEPNVIYQLF